MATKTKRIIVPLAEDDLRIIEDYRHAHRVSTRAGAIRRLIRRGARGGDGGLARALGALREHKGELLALGIRHAAVFGSTARGEAKADADTDILVEFDRKRLPDLFQYAAIRRRIGEIVAGADVVEKGSLRSSHLVRVIEEAVHAF